MRCTPGHIPPPPFQCLMAAGEEQGRSKSHKKVQTAIKIISQLIFSRSPVSPPPFCLKMSSFCYRFLLNPSFQSSRLTRQSRICWLCAFSLSTGVESPCCGSWQCRLLYISSCSSMNESGSTTVET